MAPRIYVGVDIGKASHYAVAVDRDGEVVHRTIGAKRLADALGLHRLLAAAQLEVGGLQRMRHRFRRGADVDKQRGPIRDLAGNPLRNPRFFR